MTSSSQKRKYLSLDYPSGVTGTSTYLTGLSEFKKKQYITGFYEVDGKSKSFVVTGKLKCGKLQDQKWVSLNYSLPGLTAETRLKGINVLCKGFIRAVGTVKSQAFGEDGPYGPVTNSGVMYEGLLDGSGHWTLLNPLPEEEANETVANSTMGDLVVGFSALPGNPRRGFIYNIKTKQYEEFNPVDHISAEPTGIWYNGNNMYTLCGLVQVVPEHIGMGFVIDYNSETNVFSNLKVYNYKNGNPLSVKTLFNSITSDKCGGYNLTGFTMSNNKSLAFAANIGRNPDKTFTDAVWVDVAYPGATQTFPQSIYLDKVVGFYLPGAGNSPVSGFVSYVK